MSIGNRLREALKRRGGKSLRWLSVTLLKQNVRGASYASVHDYVHDGTTPNLEFLNAAADALHVHRAWLLHGEGLPDTVPPGGTPLGGTLDRQVRDLRRAVPALEHQPTVVQAVFLEALRRYGRGLELGLDRRRPGAKSRTQARERQQARYERLAGDLWRFVELPERVCGFRASLTSDEAVAYALAILNALMLAMPEPGKGSLSETSLAAHFATATYLASEYLPRFKRPRRPR